MNDFVKCLTLLAEHFGKKVTPLLIDSYVFALEGYDEKQLIATTKTLIRGQYFPRAHDFIAALEGETPDAENLANLRWVEIVDWINDSGAFPDDDIARSVLNKIGDHYMLKRCTDAELRGHGFTFRAAYQAQTAIQAARNEDHLLAEAPADMIKALSEKKSW